MASIIAQADSVPNARGGSSVLAAVRNKLADGVTDFPISATIQQIALDGSDITLTFLDKNRDDETYGFNEDQIKDILIMVADQAVSVAQAGEGGYEFTGGFVDRTTGSAGANDLGSNVQYTTAMASNDTWLRFGFSAAQQAINDVEYWGETSPDFDQTKGLFGGLHMPPGITNLIDYSDTSLEAAVETGDLQYTEAAGSYDLTGCSVGDLVKIRFSFNAVPQVANSTLEVGLIFATRDQNDDVTFTFPLTTQPVFYGTGSQGVAYLNRVEMSAYIASDEDLNARILPAVRCNNEILIQPLSTLISIIR